MRKRRGPTPKVDDATIRQMLADGLTLWKVEAVLGYADGALYQRKCVREFRGLPPYKRARA